MAGRDHAGQAPDVQLQDGVTGGVRLLVGVQGGHVDLARQPSNTGLQQDTRGKGSVPNYVGRAKINKIRAFLEQVLK